MDARGIKNSFKAYDIRGRVPEELDEELSYCLGLALVSEFLPRRVVLGRDARLSGPALAAALVRGLREAGVEITDIGVCGTEEIYFAAARHGFDLGVMFTASHNPAEYNGIKLVRAGAVPVSGDSGLHVLRERILRRDFAVCSAPLGALIQRSFRDEYIAFLLSRLKLPRQRPLKIVMNPGNGCAWPVLERLLPRLPGEVLSMHTEPDGAFPNGVPNPLLPERRKDTALAVRAHKADLGLAWDGDFDRCFFYDAEGSFVESYYLIGMLARKLLAGCPGGTILHDTRLFWNTVELTRAAGGLTARSKTGHAFMKESLRREDALYGGEMSAHHYFRDFSYCDSGMLPWLNILEILDAEDCGLAELVAERVRAYPCSGEINFKAAAPGECVRAARAFYASEIRAEDNLDGLSADCGLWRFNLRSSNTEPLLRLNVESRGEAGLLAEKTAQLAEIIGRCGGERVCD